MIGPPLEEIIFKGVILLPFYFIPLKTLYVELNYLFIMKEVKKYKLTEETKINKEGITLHRIQRT